MEDVQFIKKINATDDNMDIFDLLSDNFELDKSGISRRIAYLIRGFNKRCLTLNEYEELMNDLMNQMITWNYLVS